MANCVAINNVMKIIVKVIECHFSFRINLSTKENNRHHNNYVSEKLKEYNSAQNYHRNQLYKTWMTVNDIWVVFYIQQNKTWLYTW